MMCDIKTLLTRLENGTLITLHDIGQKHGTLRSIGIIQRKA